ncbi:flagellin [Hydrogenovibrio halophilus]|uniref:flagellin n=1 Tax=Hydrogenovibrio halophilus TaxID=373391 RepID=UPI00036657BB|nr:flagellin [Hydrogenovibrio halophilus]
MAIDSISTNNSYANFNNRQLDSTNESLASGSRINRSADDPAGQAVVTAMTSQINVQDQGVRNANDGVNLMQTADGALENIQSQIQTLTGLSVQAMNGTYNDSQRQAMNQQFTQTLQGIDQIAQTTQFNGMNLLNGENASVNIALGGSQNELQLADMTNGSTGLSGLSLNSADDARAANEMLTTVMEGLQETRSSMGAQQNALTTAADNLMNQNVNTQASRAQINDTDYAKAVTEQTREQVLQQAQIAMQAQSNQSQSDVLALLN